MSRICFYHRNHNQIDNKISRYISGNGYRPAGGQPVKAIQGIYNTENSGSILDYLCK